jgi:hypothetical protein
MGKFFTEICEHFRTNSEVLFFTLCRQNMVVHESLDQISAAPFAADALSSGLEFNRLTKLVLRFPCVPACFVATSFRLCHLEFIYSNSLRQACVSVSLKLLYAGKLI